MSGLAPVLYRTTKQPIWLLRMPEIGHSPSQSTPFNTPLSLCLHSGHSSHSKHSIHSKATTRGGPVALFFSSSESCLRYNYSDFGGNGGLVAIFI
jgi:hypothetical protein